MTTIFENAQTFSWRLALGIEFYTKTNRLLRLEKELLLYKRLGQEFINTDINALEIDIRDCSAFLSNGLVKMYAMQLSAFYDEQGLN